MVNNSEIDNVYTSLSDSTRRDILLSISGGDLVLSSIAKKHQISLPAISKHLKVLEKAKLIKREKVGREHHFSLTMAATYWVEQFQSLEKFLRSTKKS